MVNRKRSPGKVPPKTPTEPTAGDAPKATPLKRRLEEVLAHFERCVEMWARQRRDPMTEETQETLVSFVPGDEDHPRCGPMCDTLGCSLLAVDHDNLFAPKAFAGLRAKIEPLLLRRGWGDENVTAVTVKWLRSRGYRIPEKGIVAQGRAIARALCAVEAELRPSVHDEWAKQAAEFIPGWCRRHHKRMSSREIAAKLTVTTGEHVSADTVRQYLDPILCLDKGLIQIEAGRHSGWQPTGWSCPPRKPAR